MKATILFLMFVIYIPYLFSQSHDDFEDGITNIQNPRTTQNWQMGASDNAVNIPGDTSWAGLPNGISGVNDNYMVLMPDNSGSSGKLIVKNKTQWVGDFRTFTHISMNIYNLTGSSIIDLRMAFKLNGGDQDPNLWVSSTNAVSISNSPGWQSVTFPVDSNSLTALGTTSKTTILTNVEETRILDASSGPEYRGDFSTDTLAIDNITLGDTPLAVELSTLNAISSTDKITLRWTTESELNNLGFRILKSKTENGLFEDLDSYLSNDALKGLGNSSFGGNYSFTDEKVTPGNIYWYKLQDVSFHGQVTELGITSASVSESKDIVLGSVNLLQNFPNPFNPSTKISISISQDYLVPTSLNIYNSTGQKIETLFDGSLGEGLHTFTWDGKNYQKINVASGVYMYRVSSGGFVASKKMILIR